MTSEAMGFAAALGLNTRQAFEHLKASEADSWMFDNRVPHMLDRDPTIYSALNIITKDIVSLLPSHTRFIELTFAQGIVTAGARAEKFPLFLASATEQVLAAGVSAGIGLEDDANLTKVYLPKRPDLVFEQASEAATTTADDPKLKLVAQAMAGVHLAAAAEAMTLGAKVGLDTTQLQEIIATAAGTSWMFVDRAPQMLSGVWQSKKTIEEVIRELVRLFSPLGDVPGLVPSAQTVLTLPSQTESIDEASRMKSPLHLAGTALQLFQLAAVRGLGQEADVAVYRVWDGADGPVFPGRS
jgi:3-hydroxyisobutyrate dehydrogenase